MSHELTDLHNRRKNLEYVSRHAKLNGWPLLAWPEDIQLARLGDLPILEKHINKPPDWRTMEESFTYLIECDADLRKVLTPGFAYAITGYHSGGWLEVQSWRIESR